MLNHDARLAGFSLLFNPCLERLSKDWMPVKFGYWNIRAYAQPIRLLLAYAGVEIEEKRYNFIGANWDRSEWLNEKFTLGLEFPNLPYYMDDGVKLSQTFTILKYLGRKHGLAPRNEAERIRVDLIEAEAMDLRTKWVAQCYGNFVDPYDLDKFNKSKPEFIKNTVAKFKEISAFLGDRQFVAGDHLTYIDFLMYELLDIHSILEPTILDEVPNLKAYHDRIQELPTVASYMKSDKFIKRPLNGPMAVFVGN